MAFGAGKADDVVHGEKIGRVTQLLDDASARAPRSFAPCPGTPKGITLLEAFGHEAFQLILRVLTAGDLVWVFIFQVAQGKADLTGNFQGAGNERPDKHETAGSSLLAI